MYRITQQQTRSQKSHSQRAHSAGIVGWEDTRVGCGCRWIYLRSTGQSRRRTEEGKARTPGLIRCLVDTDESLAKLEHVIPIKPR